MDSSEQSLEGQIHPPAPEEHQNQDNSIQRKGFFLLFPPVQALIIYLTAALVIAVWGSATKTQVYEVAFYALTGFTLLSPAINIFLRKWWWNTGLYILSLVVFWIFLEALVEPSSSRSGTGIGEGAIVFMLPMFLPFFALPISGILRFLVYRFQKSRDNQKELLDSS